jgi:hypothetical protein
MEPEFSEDQVKAFSENALIDLYPNVNLNPHDREFLRRDSTNFFAMKALLFLEIQKPQYSYCPKHHSLDSRYSPEWHS